MVNQYTTDRKTPQELAVYVLSDVIFGAGDPPKLSLCFREGLRQYLLDECPAPAGLKIFLAVPGISLIHVGLIVQQINRES